jgi:hypothetical protein
MVEQIYIQNTPTPDDQYPLGTGSVVAQTFIAPDDFDLTRVELSVARSGAPTAEVLEIREAADDTPTAKILGTAKVPGSDLGTSFAVKSFDFPSKIRLTKGTKYALYIYGEGVDTTTNFVHVQIKKADTYPNGQILVSGDSGASWVKPGYDAWFIIYGEPPPPPPPPPPSLAEQMSAMVGSMVGIMVLMMVISILTSVVKAFKK